MSTIKRFAASRAKSSVYTVKAAAIDAELYNEIDDTVASVGLVLMGFSALALISLLGWFICVTLP